MQFKIKVFGFDSTPVFDLPLESAKQAISVLSTTESIEQIWVFNQETKEWQIQKTRAQPRAHGGFYGKPILF